MDYLCNGWLLYKVLTDRHCGFFVGGYERQQHVGNVCLSKDPAAFRLLEKAQDKDLLQQVDIFTGSWRRRRVGEYPDGDLVGRGKL